MKETRRGLCLVGLVALSIFCALPTAPLAASHPDKLHVLALLEARSFEALDVLLNGIQEHAEKDLATEVDASIAFQAFATSRPGVEALLTEWKKARPKSYQADVAAAIFYVHRAYQRRGGGAAADTTKEQFAAMRKELAEASGKVVASLSGHATAEGYSAAISIARAMGDHERERQIADRGLAQFPASFTVRRDHMMTLLPRWGGSYDAMQRFAEESQKHARQNPKLQRLRGIIAWDMGRVAVSAKNYGLGAQLFTKALELGGQYSLFYGDRADAYLRMKENEKALGDANQALELFPQDPDSLADRAKVLCQLGELDQAAKDLALASSLDPEDEGVKRAGETLAGKLVSEAYEAQRSGNDAKGMAMLDQALALAPNRAETLYWRGRAHLQRSRLDLAEKDFRAALNLDPKHFETCRNLDFILAKKGQWDEIVKMWTRFLELDPNNAGAYLERAGTYKNKGEMASAFADLKKACELGNANACQILEREGAKPK